MVKKFIFRGHTFEELEEMSISQVMELFNARQRRTLKRGFTEPQKKLLAKIEEAKKLIKQGKTIKPIRTHLRELIVIPKMVGVRLAVHNGKEFVMLDIKPEMIGHYLGEFALTRRRVLHHAPGVGATRSSMFVPIK